MCQCWPLSHAATRFQTEYGSLACAAGAASVVPTIVAAPTVVMTAATARLLRRLLVVLPTSSVAAETDASVRGFIRTFPGGVTATPPFSDRSPSSWASGRH